MKAISYIRKLADTWNPAQLNEALKYLGFKTVDTWNPAELEETKNKLVKYFIPTDAYGNPIELNLKGVLPYEVTALTIDLLPIQDLHGYDSPWAGGVGKNKLQNNGTSKTENGVTFTVNDDGSVIIQTEEGGATNNTNLLIKAFTGIDGTKYTINGIPRGLSSINMTAGNLGATDTGSGASFTYDSTKTDKNVRIWCLTGFTATTPITVKPMIRLSSVSDGTFAPYENICPISGRNSVTLTVNGDDTEITFEDTVYGGNSNVLEGGTSSTYGYIASYDSEELPGVWISDRDAYAAGTDPTTGAEVVYVLTTPTELITPANEIALVNGVNTLSTDGDTINITYKAILN
jgi:hypothetical protein